MPTASQNSAAAATCAGVAAIRLPPRIVDTPVVAAPAAPTAVAPPAPDRGHPGRRGPRGSARGRAGGRTAGGGDFGVLALVEVVVRGVGQIRVVVARRRVVVQGHGAAAGPVHVLAQLLDDVLPQLVERAADAGPRLLARAAGEGLGAEPQ